MISLDGATAVTAIAEYRPPATRVCVAASRHRANSVSRYPFPRNPATSQKLSGLSPAHASSDHEPDSACSRHRYDSARAGLPGTGQPRGVSVRRVRTTRFGGDRLVGRALDHIGFLWAALMKRMVMLRPGDIVVAMTDRPMMSVAVSRMVVAGRAVPINLLQDIFSTVAERIGIRGVPMWLATLLRWTLSLSLRSARLNVVISQRKAAHLVAEGIDAASVAVIGNWAGNMGPHGDASRSTVQFRPGRLSAI